jgi:hypothetical protein
MNDHKASPAASNFEDLSALGGGRVSRGLERLQLAREVLRTLARLLV